ncbi:MAG TPA: hypothetical protein VMU56_06870, partial [Beijerinckiaceae bacterium]|nr:hypothetical protein [Beijerinckiaceae bacterium]
LVLSQRAETLGASSFQAIASQAAIDLLPVWARRMHGLAGSRVTRPLVHAGTFGLARTIRWALN